MGGSHGVEGAQHRRKSVSNPLDLASEVRACVVSTRGAWFLRLRSVLSRERRASWCASSFRRPRSRHAGRCPYRRARSGPHSQGASHVSSHLAIPSVGPCTSPVWDRRSRGGSRRPLRVIRGVQRRCDRCERVDDLLDGIDGSETNEPGPECIGCRTE